MENQTSFKKRGLEERLFAKLEEKFSLSSDQVDKIQKYCALLLDANLKINLTGHKTLADVLSSLFTDSLMASKFIDFSKLSSICDVGTGAGFPGLAIKIAFPHLKVFLIEVTQKKIKFLESVIKDLDLKDVEIVSIDWRTFNRQTNFPIDLFLSKGAFRELEICRMFRQNCSYKDKALIYWAGQNWECDELVAEHVKETFDYKNAARSCRLIKFGPTKDKSS